jgi:hypothetical protein
MAAVHWTRITTDTAISAVIASDRWMVGPFCAPRSIEPKDGAGDWPATAGHGLD